MGLWLELDASSFESFMGVVSARLPASAGGPAGTSVATGPAGTRPLDSLCLLEVSAGCTCYSEVSCMGSPAQGCKVASTMAVVTFMPKGWAAHAGMGINTSGTSLAGSG